MPKKIAPDSTIATVWPHLVHQRSYVAGVLNKVRLCNKEHGNAFVKIGVTGSGQKPCYRVFHLEADGSETIFGSYWDMHDTLENEHALNANWSIAAMSYEEVHALMIDKSPSDNVRPGLSGRDGGDSRRVLKPHLDVPCGPRPLAGSIAVRACATKPT
ncbi:hypothetical protein [Methylobacterium sp. Leaf102]|uniref:hypothetical protein n=1 Tax=Methylobacterium sp. Leaf102 TaxID=1736253 RepID=UPI001FCD9DD7|nr:hypothetical protein [Methylobacterium sp. Leaf102]